MSSNFGALAVVLGVGAAALYATGHLKLPSLPAIGGSSSATSGDSSSTSSSGAVATGDVWYSGYPDPETALQAIAANLNIDPNCLYGYISQHPGGLDQGAAQAACAGSNASSAGGSSTAGIDPILVAAGIGPSNGSCVPTDRQTEYRFQANGRWWRISEGAIEAALRLKRPDLLNPEDHSLWYVKIGGSNDPPTLVRNIVSTAAQSFGVSFVGPCANAD